MTLAEFSTEFDLLFNNIGSINSPGLTDYEKSVFLTKAQDEIIKSYFNSVYNKAQEGFDDSPKRQYDFSSLICTTILPEINKHSKESNNMLEKIDKRSKIFILPEDHFLIINEVISDSNNKYSVIPMSYSEYQRLLLKPYSLPTKRSAWRLYTDKKSCTVGKSGNITSQSYFYIISTTVDIPLKITIKHSVNSNISSNFAVSDTTIQFLYKDDTIECPVKITATLENINADALLPINLTIDSNLLLEDSKITNIIKQGFNIIFTGKYLNEEVQTKNYTIYKVASYLDGFSHVKTSNNSFLFYSGVTVNTVVTPFTAIEVIGKFKEPIDYHLRYIKIPSPIILSDIAPDTIRKVNSATECKLPSEIHPEILQRAVELAKAAYSGEIESIISIGNASATEKGMMRS